METPGIHLCAVGVNHRTMPIVFRERLAIPDSQLGDALASLNNYVSQGIILSTCNRTEIYALDSDIRLAEQNSLDFLKSRINISDQDLLPHVYIHQAEKAIEHLFCVASGLDSMIIGEFEILGQVRLALEQAERTQLASLPLLNLFRQAVRVGRRARTETGISQNALSVSSVAVDLAMKVVGDLSRCRIIVIGAGEAGTLVAKAARERGSRQIAITTRSQEKASVLAAALGGRSVHLSNLKEELEISDIVISCTGSPHLILDSPLVLEAMKARPQKPLVIIDIAVPRDVEPEVERIDNVFLYNIDHLIEISDSNRKLREDEIHRAEEIVGAEVHRFSSWWQTLEVLPVISALVKRAEDMRQTQLNRTLKKLRDLSDEERDSLEAMTKAIVQKLLHEPIQCLKENAHNTDYAQMVCKLFQLDDEEPE